MAKGLLTAGSWGGRYYSGLAVLGLVFGGIGFKGDTGRIHSFICKREAARFKVYVHCGYDARRGLAGNPNALTPIKIDWPWEC